MSIWHSDYTVSEEHNTRRVSADDKRVDATIVLRVDASIINDFLFDLFVDRQEVELPGGYLVRPVRIDHIQDAAVYNAGTTDQIVPLHTYLVTVSYSSDIRIAANIFGQDVLITEKLSPVTEYLTQAFDQFAWESTPDQPLTSSDMAPGKIFRSFKIDMTIERIEMTDSGLLEALQYMSSTTNDDTYPFLWPWSISSMQFGPETLMGMVEGFEPTIKIKDKEDDTHNWGIVRVSFTYRPNGWNKFWRYKKAGDQDDSEWERIVHIKTAENVNTPVVENMYPLAGWIAMFFNKTPLTTTT